MEGCCVQQPLQALCLPSQSCKKVNIGYEIASRHRIGIVKPDIFEAFYSSPSSFPINTSNELLPPLYHPPNHIRVAYTCLRICRFQWFQNMFSTFGNIYNPVTGNQLCQGCVYLKGQALIPLCGCWGHTYIKVAQQLSKDDHLLCNRPHILTSKIFDDIYLS